MLEFQILGVSFGIILSLVVLFLTRAGMLREKYSLVWLIISGFILVVSLFRGLLEAIANLAGIVYAPSALFAIMIGAAFILLLSSAVSTSHIMRNNKDMIQKIGLLELEVNKLKQIIANNEREGKNNEKNE